MGMAASQARLLTLTARLADNELRSQTINNAKMRLATQSAQASDDYVRALNNATYKFTNYDATGAMVNQALTFNALTTYSPYNTQYGLVNAANQLLVSESEAIIFDRNKTNLDAYLKEHGLVYDTTYFDRFDTNPVTNFAYPEPFDKLDGVTLKKYYEEYNSYETSIEVEKYERLYSSFSQANDNLSLVGEGLFKQYITKNDGTFSDKGAGITETGPHNVSNPLTQENPYKIDLSGSTISEIVNKFKNAFSGNNAYNINRLKAGNYVYQDALDYCEQLIQGIQLSGGNLVVNEPCSLTFDPVTNIYSIDGGDIKFKVADDGSGKIDTYPESPDATKGIGTYLDYSGLKRSEEDTTSTPPITMTFNEPTDPTTLSTISAFINSLNYTLSDDPSMTYKYKMDNNGNVTKSYQIKDLDKAKGYLDDSFDAIIIRLLSRVNPEVFTNAVQNDPKNLYCNLDDTCGGTGKSYREIIVDYDRTRNEFLEYIFGESPAYDDVIDDIKNAKEYTMKEAVDGSTPVKLYNGKDDTRPVTGSNLKDIEFVLQYMKQRPLSCGENFETVIKKYLIDDLIDEYGTPKYAWIDENDKTSNQENADAKAQWYTNLFKRMQQGYKVLENGLANSTEWIEYALESGTVFMEQVDSAFVWNALDYKTCTRITEETDDVAVARAEAEYNRAMNDIKTKDNFYDLELKNIDTEHNALQTEYDVIKGVINKNIERNFKFNQSA